MTHIFGLSTCDTCRKARKSFENAGIEAAFQDVRDTPLTPEQIAQFLGKFGEKLVNTRSTTWRGLDDAARAAAPEALLSEHPTLMKRPVIVTGEVMTLGWTVDTLSEHQA